MQPDHIRDALDHLTRRYDGPVPAEARIHALCPDHARSYTLREISASVEHFTELCQSNWAKCKHYAAWISQSRGGITAISDRLSFDHACRLLKVSRLARDQWKQVYRDHIGMEDQHG